MTDWPWCIAEIALYTAVFAAFGFIGVGMTLDARKRWRQYRAEQEGGEPDANAESEPDEPETSAVRSRTNEPDTELERGRQ